MRFDGRGESGQFGGPIGGGRTRARHDRRLGIARKSVNVPPKLVPRRVCLGQVSSCRSFAPPGLANLNSVITHGLRHGLYSCGASRLSADWLLAGRKFTSSRGARARDDDRDKVVGACGGHERALHDGPGRVAPLCGRSLSAEPGSAESQKDLRRPGDCRASVI